MRVAEHGVAAPRARERTTARGNQRDRPLTVMFAPYVDIFVLIDGGAIGKRLRVQVREHRPRLGSYDAAVVAAEGNALNGVEPGWTVLHEVRHELLQRELAFADCDDVRAARQI